MPPLTIALKEALKRWFVSGSRHCEATRWMNALFDLAGRPRSRDTETSIAFSLRKEVIQPQVLLRLPCYDFTPIMNHTLGGCSLAVSAPTSSTTHFRDVTGGVYKARERIHRSVLICDY